MANISKITLPNGSTYDIYDAAAVHVNDITALMDLKGTKATYADLPTSGNKKGDVWLISQTGEEYIYDGSQWIKLGYNIQAASTTHTHNVTVTGTNAASSVSGTIDAPSVSIGKKYVSATATQGTVTPSKDSVLGADTTFSTKVTPTTTNIKATASGVAVGANGTADAITTITPSTGSAMGTDATFSVSGGAASTSKMDQVTITYATKGSDIAVPVVASNQEVSIPNVTNKGSATPGQAAEWSAKVEDGTLSFSWKANTPTAVTMPTLGTAIKATNTVFGTAITTSQIGTDSKTVATGTLSSSGKGAQVATGVSAISVAVSDAKAVPVVNSIDTDTTAVLTGVKVTAQPTVALATGATAGTGVISVATGISSATTTHSGNNNVDALTGVSVANPTVVLSTGSTNATGAAAVDAVSKTTETVAFTGTAAAQKWTQATGTTETPLG